MSNVTLIGMPASGKSTVGVLLAKRIGFSFIDVDIVIQEKEKRLLKEIIRSEGLQGFLEIENRINSELDVDNAIIAPGGSVIFGKEAMKHLKEISLVVYLKISYESLVSRLGDITDRGVVLEEGMNLQDLYHERTPLYEKYADIIIEEDDKSFGEVIDELRRQLEQIFGQKS